MPATGIKSVTYEVGLRRFVNSVPENLRPTSREFQQIAYDNYRRASTPVFQPVERPRSIGERIYQARDWVDQVDRAFAGFASVITAGYSDSWRAGLYGEEAVRNHQGAAYNVGQGAGVAHSVALAITTGGASTTVQTSRTAALAQRASSTYLVAQDAQSIATSTHTIYNKSTNNQRLHTTDYAGFTPLLGIPSGASRTLRQVPSSEGVAPARVPDPYGKLGSPAHRAKVQDVVADIEARGLHALTEVPINTVNGQKDVRFMDVVAIDPKTNRVVEVHQVGRTLKSDPMVPVARERAALRDVRHVPQLRGAKRFFHDYQQ